MHASRDSATTTRLTRGAWHAGLRLAAALLVIFIALPVFALIFTLGWDAFTTGLSNRSVMPALKLTLLTTLLSVGIIVLLGTPLAWLLSRNEGRKYRVIETLVRLPVVLPPAVAGLGLLLAFGRKGLLGDYLLSLGIQIPFTKTAIVLAMVFVSAPFYIQAATQAFRDLDDSQLLVARTLGASPPRIFFRIALPIASPGLAAGAALSWARALGEFGATLLFAGTLSGERETLTLAVYTAWQAGDTPTAQSISLLLIAIAFTLFVIMSTLTRRKAPKR